MGNACTVESTGKQVLFFKNSITIDFSGVINYEKNSHYLSAASYVDRIESG